MRHRRPLPLLLHSLLAVLLAFFTVLGCETQSTPKIGVQKEYVAYIPARIAVLPCRLWPQGALFPGQAPTTLPTEALCEQMDQYVLRGFDGQPFMRGLSPKVVQALLERNGQTKLMSGLEDLWFRPGQACEKCKTPAAYYRSAIAPRTEWRTWLSTLSRATTNSDAIFLPFIVSIQEEKVDDRGLFYAQRSAEIVFLLIDSNNGQLIWSGGRAAETRLPVSKGPDALKPEQYPSWDEVWKRVFTDDLWLEFPGRQT